jgi:hypothetical protein
MTPASLLRQAIFIASLAAISTVRVAAGAQATGERPGPAQAPATTAPASQTAVPITESDLERIRKALDSSPSLKIDDSQLRFYVQILAKERTLPNT